MRPKNCSTEGYAEAFGVATFKVVFLHAKGVRTHPTHASRNIFTKLTGITVDMVSVGPTALKQHYIAEIGFSGGTSFVFPTITKHKGRGHSSAALMHNLSCVSEIAIFSLLSLQMYSGYRLGMMTHILSFPPHQPYSSMSPRG